jgi:hypothetical protein
MYERLEMHEQLEMYERRFSEGIRAGLGSEGFSRPGY